MESDFSALSFGTWEGCVMPSWLYDICRDQSSQEKSKYSRGGLWGRDRVGAEVPVCCWFRVVCCEWTRYCVCEWITRRNSTRCGILFVLGQLQEQHISMLIVTLLMLAFSCHFACAWLCCHSHRLLTMTLMFSHSSYFKHFLTDHTIQHSSWCYVYCYHLWMSESSRVTH